MDHNCWERPEDMDKPQNVFKLVAQHPGSNIAAETDGALAAASIVFSTMDRTYSNLFLQNAMQVTARLHI